MFSRRPRAPERIEIVYPAENFTWQEDPAKPRRIRKLQIWTLSIGLILAAAVLGNAVGIGWLFSKVTNAETHFIAGPG